MVNRFYLFTGEKRVIKPSPQIEGLEYTRIPQANHYQHQTEECTQAPIREVLAQQRPNSRADHDSDDQDTQQRIIQSNEIESVRNTRIGKTLTQQEQNVFLPLG